MGKSNQPSFARHYSLNYENFQAELYAQIRQEAYGEDIGQNSWHTAEEQEQFLSWLELGPGRRGLDVACGAGGAVLRIAERTGCDAAGVDLYEQAVKTASALAKERGAGAASRSSCGGSGSRLAVPG